MAIPIITFTNSTNAISTVKTCTVVFSVDEDFIEFEARGTKEGNRYGHGVGLLINSMSILSPNYYPKDTNYTFVITSDNLTLGDGQYRISLYAKNKDGIWSDAVAFMWDSDSSHGWDNAIWI